MSATIGTRIHTLLFGKYVGQDEFGNRYFRHRSAKQGQHLKRWVIYKGIPEPSKVPALWHAWLHYTTDKLPDEMGIKRYDWQKEHMPNLTGTAGAYVPPGHIKRGASRDASSSDYQAWSPDKA